jgi:hypothetical protein
VPDVVDDEQRAVPEGSDEGGERKPVDHRCPAPVGPNPIDSAAVVAARDVDGAAGPERDADRLIEARCNRRHLPRCGIEAEQPAALVVGDVDAALGVDGEPQRGTEANHDTDSARPRDAHDAPASDHVDRAGRAERDVSDAAERCLARRDAGAAERSAARAGDEHATAGAGVDPDDPSSSSSAAVGDDQRSARLDDHPIGLDERCDRRLRRLGRAGAEENGERSDEEESADSRYLATGRVLPTIARIRG